jgi:hypothetical protein
VAAVFARVCGLQHVGRLRGCPAVRQGGDGARGRPLPEPPAQRRPAVVAGAGRREEKRPGQGAPGEPTAETPRTEKYLPLETG